MTINEPPAGFDPLTASEKELQRWGFPPRPSNAEGLEGWRDLVGGYEKPVVAPGCEDSNISRKFLGEEFNENWSGMVNVAPNNQSKWKAVIGTFYQPYDHGSCASNASVASWVGLGGNYTGRFIQTGTEIRANGSKEAWVEIWAGEYSFSYSIPNFPFQAGNYIRLYAGYNKSLEIAYFYITNDATGQTVLTEWHIGQQFYDGSSAEWIDEAPYTGSGQLPLLNFDRVDWYSNTTQNAQDQVLPIDASNYFKAVPWHGNHRTSWPGAIWNHQNYSDFFYTCQ